MDKKVPASCTVEPMDPADLLSSVQSVPPSLRSDVIHSPLGDGFERLLSWALSDLRDAKASSGEDVSRHATNAMMNARRALSCLVDQYLKREGLLYCKHGYFDAGGKARLLLRRGILDELSLASLERAVLRRNSAEHRYHSVPLSDAEDSVDLIRRTIESVTARCDPYVGPLVFGRFSHGSRSSQGSDWSYFFTAWSKSVVILATFAELPWVGVIVPDGPRSAILRQARLADIEVDTFLEVLEALDSCNDSSGSQSLSIWQGIFKEADIDLS